MSDGKMWEIEDGFFSSGVGTICGVDEAGRGPLAGPVYAAAVILPRGCVIEGLNDSKKLTEKKREALYGVITETALAWSVASVSAAAAPSKIALEDSVAPETVSTLVLWVAMMVFSRAEALSIYGLSSVVLTMVISVIFPPSMTTCTVINPEKPVPEPVYVPSL